MLKNQGTKTQLHMNRQQTRDNLSLNELSRRGRSLVETKLKIYSSLQSPVDFVECFSLSQSFTQSAQKKYRIIQKEVSNTSRTSNRFAKENYFKIKEIKNVALKSLTLAEYLKKPPAKFKPYDLSVIPSKVYAYHEPFKLGIQNIEKIMAQENFDFFNRIGEHTHLPLENFQDSLFDDISDQQIHEKLKNEKSLRGQIMIMDRVRWKWFQVTIIGYEKNMFAFKTDYMQGQCCRIAFILNFEDPYRYLDKLDQAFKLRERMASLTTYNKYIQNMKDDEQKFLPLQQQQRIIKIINLPLKIEFMQVEPLLIQVQKEYQIVQNQCRFNKEIPDDEEGKIIKQNQIVQFVKPKLTSQFGLLQLQQGMVKVISDSGTVEFFKPRAFLDLICFFNTLSLYSCKEVLSVLAKIRIISNNILRVELFYFRQKQIIKIEDLRNSMDSISQRSLNAVKQEWISSVVNIIKQELKIINKKSQVLPEEMLDRFFQMVRMLLQDTLLAFIKKNFRKMINFFVSSMPSEVLVKDTTEVQNIYLVGQPTQDRKRDFDLQMFHDPEEECFYPHIKPMFTISIVLSPQENDLIFSFPLKMFLLNMQNIVEKTLVELQTVSDPEPRILDNYFKFLNRAYLKSSKRPSQDFYDEDNEWVQNLWEQLIKICDNITDPLQQYLKKFEVYQDLLEYQQPKTQQKRKENEDEDQIKEIEGLRLQIIKNKERIASIKQEIPQEIHVSIFLIQLSETIKQLTKKLEGQIQALFEILSQKVRNINIFVIEAFEQIQDKIKEQPKNVKKKFKTQIEQLVQILEYMQNDLPSEIQRNQVLIQNCLFMYDVLEEFSFHFRGDDIQRRWQMFGMPQLTMELVSKIKINLDFQKNSLANEQALDQVNFKDEIEQLEIEIYSFNKWDNINQLKDSYKRVLVINKMLTDYQDQGKLFNVRENLLGIGASDYNKLYLLQKEFLPYSNLWSVCETYTKNIDKWLNSEWNDLDALGCEKFMTEGYRLLVSSLKHFRERNSTKIIKIGEQLKAQLDDFKPKVPLMMALKRQGMNERHWEALSSLVGFQIKIDENFNFSQALNLGLMEHMTQCIEMGERAQKEFNIESMLNEMKSVWADLKFTTTPYKNTYILKGLDEIQVVLDEHILNTQSLQFSPYKKPFEVVIVDWNHQLKQTSDILEECSKLQTNWLYLQPIFESPDISKQLPIETKKFKMVDKVYKDLAQICFTSPNIMRVCNIESILDRLIDANLKLEQVQRELNNYLEKKREKFARFYFLSNDDLLEILSQSKEPTAVQPHLKKVFENMHLIEFDSQKSIIAMMSAEGEKVKFSSAVDPNQKNVEEWMGLLEDEMKQSVRVSLLKSVEMYASTPREVWLLEHPGQCVLNGSQIVWTDEVEEAINGGRLKEQLFKMDQQIGQLVGLLRRKLSKQGIVTINALIVIDVHAKDVVESIQNKQISSVGEFEWIMQMRYYLVGGGKDLQCRVKCIQTDFPYGYEYLGNTLRLVITPLTDKCYMTLMGALQLNLGGAPAGPAGTGKTETTKDLAKALAKQCVVFNCSHSMDYMMLGKFFKGLAGAGAWCCFDEFNRINIEVLSVIAQQLLVLFEQKSLRTKDCIFEASMIKINPTFCVFITMNPGYAGRTELPDNLKALFRSVAMMVPDYAMIGEIMLYSFGFNEGRSLAKKMVATFKLSSEQLSSQDHYDYGMRAVRSVINAAGLLKQKHPDDQEQNILLKALKDVNVPKFLKEDLPLFENIIKDLFPNLEQVRTINPLESFIKKVIDLKTLYPHPNFIEKCIQFHSTILVRHGIMLVGQCGSGKTTAIQVTANAIQDFKVNIKTINPKSIKMGELYGQFNLQTQEWSDGILALTVRQIVRDPQQGSCLHWIVLDGPVDSLWIESMNTVLDDNKKLCLNSGQILSLTENVTMLFEVEDLSVASPATVSRCGMVYMEPTAMGYQPLLYRQLRTRFINDTLMSGLERICIQYLDVVLVEVLKQTQIIDQNQLWLVDSFCSVLQSMLAYYIQSEVKRITAEDLERLEKNLDLLVVYCLAWAFIPTLATLQSKQTINCLLLDLLKQSPTTTNIKGFLLDYQLSIPNFDLCEFTITPHFDSRLQYHELIVPTIESCGTNFMVSLLLSNNYHVLTTGPTGVGKTVNAMNLLKSREAIQYVSLTFSAQSTASQTQDTIDSKLEKRRKGVYGPPIGKKCVVYIDDLNMPKKEEYGAQPPIELVRQFMDHGGWYHRKELFFMTFEDTIFLSSMGPPGGGRTFISNRLLRHYCVMGSTEFESQTILYIFETIMKHFFKPNEVMHDFITVTVQRTIDLYQFAKLKLLPTPGKAHYSFNLRDVWRVIQGLCQCNNLTSTTQLQRLWQHEAMRVFSDRLTNDPDRTQIQKLLDSNNNLDSLLFCDFEQFGYKSAQRPYEEVQGNIGSLLEASQSEFNLDFQYCSNPNKESKLVFFQDAIKHLLRIQRIIRLPQGNALLLGVGGSGRQSLSRLAAFLCRHILYQIELVKNYSYKNWREDLRKTLMVTGLNNTPVCFIVVDTQIVNESMLDDICGVLNSGDVTNLYGEKELEEIIQTCRVECIQKNLQPNKMNIYAEYLARVRNNIHIVVCMSPMSTSFSNRLRFKQLLYIFQRMFPSLVNCSTIDWFTEWPTQALIGVGTSYLQEFEEHDKVVQYLQYMHQSVNMVSKQYLKDLGRPTHFTSTSYLGLLRTYVHIYTQKKTEYHLHQTRIKNGLDKLLSANEAVEVLKKNLIVMGPQLEKASEETQIMMIRLDREKAEAAQKQVQVSREEQSASIQQEEATELAQKAQQSVAEANLLLEVTLQEVQKLKKDHLVEIKSLGQPPKPVRVILGGVVILNIDTVKKNGGDIIMKIMEGQLVKKEEDYFETAKRYLLNDPKDLLEMLKTYDKDNINPILIYKLEQKIMPDPDFNHERAKQCSLAVKFLYSWVKAMYDYNKVYIETRPLREKLAHSRSILDEKTAFLNSKKAELNECNRKVQVLLDLYNEKQSLMQQLKDKIIDCELKLGRAQKLTLGLSEEQKRWAKDISEIQFREKLLAGDCVVSVSMLCYSGAFSMLHRMKLQELSQQYLVIVGLNTSVGVTMKSFLSVPVKIQQWNLYGLPKDDTSIENGVIMDKSMRWPLMIDPQNQANKFIKMLGKDHLEGIDVIKHTDSNYMKMIEIGLQLGKWILIENINEGIDPALDPILLQKVNTTAGQVSITLGDKHISYNPQFKLLMTTRMPNPNFSAENFVKICIINFAITSSGLEEQMLAQIVTLENPKLEQKKIEIVQKNAEDSKRLQLIEDSILQALSATQGDISEVLKDEILINELQNSKKFAKEIFQRVEDSRYTEQQIDESREKYRMLAFRASLLFFCVVDLSGMDPMYHYSLQWFQQLFTRSVDQAPPSNDFNARLMNLSEHFTYQLYENVCRSLFERHKIIFSLMITVQIMKHQNELNDKEWSYFLSGAQSDVESQPNLILWIDENSWPSINRELQGLKQIPQLIPVYDSFCRDNSQFRQLYDATELPDKILSSWRLTEFQQILFIKAFRPDLVIQAITNWIALKMGMQYITVQNLSITKCFEDSTQLTPLIFILSPGSDPVKDFLAFVLQKEFTRKYSSISLGQGQGVKADKIIKEAIHDGHWVLLQNCHLAASWMGELERVVEELSNETHKDFRLWLTSMPSSTFPSSVLQNSIKMTLEPPQGLRNNLLRTYRSLKPEALEDNPKPDTYKKLLLGLSFFHAIIQDRRKFGPIGWNIPYEFTNEDMRVTLKQIMMLLENYEEVPFKVISYLCAEINYGGRVTDSNDQRLIKSILSVYLCQEALQDDHKFSKSGVYRSIEVGDLEHYLNYIEQLPLQPAPEAFGLHDNAKITFQENQTKLLIETIQKIQPTKTQGSMTSKNDIVMQAVLQLSMKIPPQFDIDQIYQTYPTNYEESMNTVLMQELIRYNRLIVLMNDSIATVNKTLKGMIATSDEVELFYQNLYDNKVPRQWESRSFLSMKPLGSWTQDLTLRIGFLNSWIKLGTPRIFWLSGFFFPQSFITATLQNYARKNIIAIDRLGFSYDYLDYLNQDNIIDKPDDGCFVYGLFLEGAKWNKQRHSLVACKPKELFSDLPVIHLKPQIHVDVKILNTYDCPLYKVTSRAGTLSTTGHSTNFVMNLKIPSTTDQEFWIRGGVASFLALSY